MVIPILAIFVIVSSGGCSVAQDWLKGSAVHSDSVFSYPTSLDRVQIGATTKSDIQNLFGRPTDIQRSSDHQQPSESWSYSKVNHAIHPLQYVPGFGVFAFSKQKHQPSFSISFSSDGIVDGIGLREVLPYGEHRAVVSTLGRKSAVQFYGTKNPMTRHARHDAAVDSKTFGE